MFFNHLEQQVLFLQDTDWGGVLLKHRNENPPPLKEQDILNNGDQEVMPKKKEVVSSIKKFKRKCYDHVKTKADKLLSEVVSQYFYIPLE